MRLADIHFRPEGGAMVAHLTGEIDLSNAREIGAALEQATPNHALALVLDLTDIEYLDSAGIQLIFRLRKRVRARGQGLRIVVPDDSPTRDALRLAGVGNHVPTVATVQGALSNLDSRDPVAESESA